MNEKLTNKTEVKEFFAELKKLSMVQQIRAIFKTCRDRESKQALLASPLYVSFAIKNKKYVLGDPNVGTMIKNGASDEEIEQFIHDKDLEVEAK